MAFTSAEQPSLLVCLRPLPAREMAAPCCGSLANSLVYLTWMVSVYVTQIVCVAFLVDDGLSGQPGWRVLVSLDLALDIPSLRVLVISGGRNSAGRQGESRGQAEVTAQE